MIGLNDWNDWNDWNDLNLYQLDLDNAKLNVQQHWDFSNYSTKTQHLRWMTQNDRREERSLSIFPKLFPINDHDYSVAIIQNWSKTYSNGGGFEDVASFVQLKSEGVVSAVFLNTPFSMNRIICTCFSEKDFQKNHEKCHDESTLDVQMSDVKP